MSEKRGTKALELWCKKMTEGYPGVKVENMTTSWRDGLAFCAIIHHFRPELIDFSKLNKDDVFYNNDLAFTVAEKYLGIPALLEPEDMVEYDVPDRLSILTYLSQFYRAFVASQGSSPARMVPKRPAISSDRGGSTSPGSTSPPTKMAIRSTAVPRREPCAKCGNPVYIAERLTVGKSLYHRTCFRCARCNSQLTLANYYETETANQFCCETCPDEEPPPAPPAEKSVLIRSLSDEEKSAGLKKFSNQRIRDEYSENFEDALENSSALRASESTEARSRFLTANLVDYSDGETPPELPKTKPPDINVEEGLAEPSSGGNSVYHSPYGTSDLKRTNTESPDRVRPNISDVVMSASEKKRTETVTKEIGKSPRNLGGVRDVKATKTETTPSLVKNRMKLFEKSQDDRQTPSTQIQESVKRPLSDISIISPEKKVSRSESPNKTRNPQESVDAPRKSTKELAESQAKSLNFLLHKQIALKEGKITPKSLRKQEELENQEKSPLLSSSSKKSPMTPKDLTKSILTSTPKKSDPNHDGIKSFPLQKSTSIPPEKMSISKSPAITPNSDLPTKLSPERDKGGQSLESHLKLNHGRGKISQKQESIAPKQKSESSIPKQKSESSIPKQKSVEDISVNQSKFTTKTFLGKNLRDAPKENLYRSPYRAGNSLEGSRSSSNLSFERSSFSHPSPVRRVSSEGFKLNESTPFRRVGSTGRLDKLRSKPHTSNPDLSDVSNQHHPMKSIENLRKSNSEEDVKGADRPNSVSALKDKFECHVVVESRPNRVEKDLESTDADLKVEGDIDLENRSVSETFLPESERPDQHGEVLRHGHITEGVTERSEGSSEDPITIDLIEDNTESPTTEGVAVITISDDSVIEISDSSLSLNRTGISDKQEDYPEDLNPFGDDNEDDKNPFAEEPSKEAKINLNPFEDDEDEENVESPKPAPAVRKKLIVPVLEQSVHEGDTPEYMKEVRVERISINPFGEDEDDEDIGVGTRHSAAGPPKKVISAPRVSLNPFWSDADEDEPEYDDDEHKMKPVPKPRKLRNSPGSNVNATPEPKPRKSNLSLGGATFGSNSSLSSSQSGGQSVRKKKPAPRPPLPVAEGKSESPNESSLTSSPSTSVSHSPRLPNKSRKSKKAPLPPSSTPQLKDSVPTGQPTLLNISPIPTTKVIETLEDDLNTSDPNHEWDNEKIVKDKVNENRRSQLFNLPHLVVQSPTNGTADLQDYVPNKSTYGKWKRKKGPAPSRPVPQRRRIKDLPVSEFRKELELIELQKQGLEKQGVRLEQIIRDRCEGPGRNENEFCDEDSVPIDVEDLILQLFEVVNEKNELSRREAELMYLQRQQRLEEEHAEVEYQIRCLMMQPEVNKTDSDKAREEELIQRLVEIVELRNEIIECLEMDRVRAAEEDDSISTSLNSYASRRDEQQSGVNTGQKTEKEKTPEQTLSKKEKSKKVKKDKKKKKSSPDLLDADKDVDESETSITSVKEKKKKKFAIF